MTVCGEKEMGKDITNFFFFFVFFFFFFLHPDGDLNHSEFLLSQNLMGSKLAKYSSSDFFFQEDPSSSIYIILPTNRGMDSHENNTS